MDFWRSVNGLLIVEITTADAGVLIKTLSDANIELFDLHDSNDLSVVAKVKRSDLKSIKRIVSKKQSELRIIGRTGTYWKLHRMVFRPIVLFSSLLLLITVFYLPGRICFVSVEGNESIPTNLILEAAQQCGIGFGSKRADVRSEKIKNMLLAEIPQIKWIGINTQGCTAVISVREGSVEKTEKEDHRVRSIVAAYDGVVEQCTVLRGNSLCRPGMAVKAGQVLVSAYTDCGITITAARADAEIFARTKRNIDVLTPSRMVQRKQISAGKKKYSIIIGKKQIKFYKGSGISGAQCVKMKEIKYLTLPGDFRLPVAIVTESEITCETAGEAQTDTVWLEEYTQSYLRSVMISGRVLSGDAAQTCATDVVYHKGTYECYEMIGIPKYEEITG